jgi:2-amino-4-hydroxy-6-hydroxymethyldihydropteridine diphosphokinase
MTTARHQFAVLLGSNIEPERNLRAAIALLKESWRLVAVSRVWQSAPFGFTAQADFLNAAALLETDESRDAVRLALRDIEITCGRVRDSRNKNAPRTLDLDIVLWSHGPLSNAIVTDYDPDLEQRVFVAAPLAEIAPDARIGAAFRTPKEISADGTGSASVSQDEVQASFALAKPVAHGPGFRTLQEIADELMSRDAVEQRFTPRLDFTLG